METERRGYRRVACKARISYSIIAQKQTSTSKKSTTVNISPSGVMFPIGHHITPNTRLDIELFLSPGSFFYTSAVKVRAIGEVRWASRVNGTKRYNLGIQFTQIKDEHRERIANYIYEGSTHL